MAAVSQGVVYLTFGGEGTTPSLPNKIEALRAQDGSVLWHTMLDGTGPVAVRVAPGALYVTSFSSLVPSPGYYYAATYLYALNASAGAVQWRYPTPDAVAVLGVAHGILYGVISHISSQSGAQDSALVALSAGTGELLWRVEIGSMEGAPLVG